MMNSEAQLTFQPLPTILFVLLIWTIHEEKIYSIKVNSGSSLLSGCEFP